MLEAAEVFQIEDEKKLVVFNNALTTFDVTEIALKNLERSANLEIKGAESEKVVRKYRQTAKSLQVKIDKRRRKLNREYKEKTDEAATILLDRIDPVYTALDTKVKAVEDERAAKKAEKDRIEKERVAKIQSLFDDLSTTIAAGMRYDNSASHIFNVLSALNSYKISSVDFQERTEEAEHLLEKGLNDVAAAYDNRVKYEADQAEAARIKAEQEAEAKRLAEEKAKLEADRKAQEEEARKKAEAEAEKRRQEEEELAAERAALEKEKANLAAKKKADEDRKAALDIFNLDHAEALKENEEFDRSRKEKLKADAERAKQVDADKKILAGIANDIDGFLSNLPECEFQTDEAVKIFIALIGTLKGVVHGFDDSVRELA